MQMGVTFTITNSPILLQFSMRRFILRNVASALEFLDSEVRN